MSITCQAIVFPQSGQVELGEIELPAPGSGQVGVRTLYSGISNGTDVWVLMGVHMGTTFPLVPGYQKVGIVDQLGPDVRGVQEGDRVFLRSTEIDSPLHCRWGGHTSYSVTDADGLFPVPEELDSKDACLLVMPAVGYHGAAEVMPIRSGELVVVIGQGLIGQFAAQVSRLQGAEVIATDILDWRLELSRQCSADYVVNPLNEDVEEMVRSRKPDGADAIIDASANEQALNESFQWMKFRGGRYCFQAYYPGLTCLNLDTPHAKEITFYIPTNVTDEGLRRCLELLASGDLKVGPLITHTLTPQEVPGVFEQLIEGSEEMLGMVIDWQQ